MKLYKTQSTNLLEHDGQFFAVPEEWNVLIDRNDLHGYLQQYIHLFTIIEEAQAHTLIKNELLPPIGNQEVWAAGVTYFRSRDARMEESKLSGAPDLYDRVYEAERPELFFKSMPHRVSGHEQPVHIRRDSTWNVPEPELTLFINSRGTIQAYTIGNDMSSRSIEGENALYLPQAKIYERSTALGPCLFITGSQLPADTEIAMTILRDAVTMYHDTFPVNHMKRSLHQLVDYLYRECEFPAGCFLMTGTSLVPPQNFTLHVGDKVFISISGIGTLSNSVALKR